VVGDDCFLSPKGKGQSFSWTPQALAGFVICQFLAFQMASCELEATLVQINNNKKTKKKKERNTAP
jgi:hypothetical protein